MFSQLKELDEAIAHNSLAQVQDILARDPLASSRRGAGRSMRLALEKASDDIVLALSDAGWNLIKHMGDRTALQEAAFRGRTTIISAWLMRYPLLWGETDRARLLVIAVRQKDLRTLRFLLDQHISDPTVRLYPGNAAQIAERERDQEALQILRAAISAKNVKAKPSQPQDDTLSAPVPPVQWHMVDDTTIIRVREQAAAGYRLTDIFNFAMGRCISVQCNLASGQETAVPLDLTLPAAALAAQEAHAQLIRAGGNPPTLPGKSDILKKAGGSTQDV